MKTTVELIADLDRAVTQVSNRVHALEDESIKAQGAQAELSEAIERATMRLDELAGGQE